MKQPKGGRGLANLSEQRDAFLYGGGDVKIGSIVKPLAAEKVQRGLGRKLKKTFAEKTAGLKRLLESLEKASSRGYLKGLDGRKIYLRSSHSALNFLLQGAGSVICKRWMVEVDMEIEKRGWRDKVQQLIWVHDECQYEVEPEIAEDFKQVAIECIPKAGEYFNIRVPLTGDGKTGVNWSSCH